MIYYVMRPPRIPTRFLSHTAPPWISRCIWFMRDFSIPRSHLHITLIMLIGILPKVPSIYPGTSVWKLLYLAGNIMHYEYMCVYAPLRWPGITRYGPSTEWRCAEALCSSPLVVTSLQEISSNLAVVYPIGMSMGKALAFFTDPDTHTYHSISHAHTHTTA